MVAQTQRNLVRHLWRWKNWEAVRVSTELLIKYDHKQPCMTYRLILGHYEILAPSQEEWMDAWLSIDRNCCCGSLWLLSGLTLLNLTLQIQMYFAFPWVKTEFNLQRRKIKTEAGQLFRKLKMPRELLDVMFLFPILLHANNSFPHKFLTESIWSTHFDFLIWVCAWLSASGYSYQKRWNRMLCLNMNIQVLSGGHC